MLSLILWLKERTFCTYFEAFKAVLPAGVTHKTVVTYTSVDGADEELMNGDEKQFMNIAQNMTAELLKVRQELTELSGLSDAKTQKIAAEIVDELTENMKNK